MGHSCVYMVNFIRSRFHYEENVVGPDGERYVVRLGRAGVHRWNLGGADHLVLSIVTWVRYLWRRQHDWTVSVWRGRFILGAPVLSETFDGRVPAASRAEQVAAGLADGSFRVGRP